jgi:hypothetical protein
MIAVGAHEIIIKGERVEYLTCRMVFLLTYAFYSEGQRRRIEKFSNR